MGTKTWSRYETGGSIRLDKVMSVCKTLKWNTLPDHEIGEYEFNINKYKSRKVWSNNLAERFGDGAALSFVIGSDILLDYIEQDLEALAHKPKGTHIGELELSYLIDCMPEQFLMNYDYELLYFMKSIVIRYRKIAEYNGDFSVHSVLDEIILYNIMEESEFFIEETIIPNLPVDKAETYEEWNDWAFDLFDDMDVVSTLYSDNYLTEDNIYHFILILYHIVE